jgi:hypothetical protein
VQLLRDGIVVARVAPMTSPMRSPLEASPELPLRKLARRRLVRRLIGGILGSVLLAGAVWAGWGIWNVRRASLSAQTPMRADRAAARRLDEKGTDLTLLVITGLTQAADPRVVLVREPETGTGTWMLALPAADLPGQGGARDSLKALFDQGRASLIKGVTGFVGFTVGHYVEIDAPGLFGAIASASGDADGGRLAAYMADASRSPSSTLSVLGEVASSYRTLRIQSLAMLRLPMLARSVSGSVVSDMGAAQLDGFFQRIGADVASKRLRSAVIPVESTPGTTTALASASGVAALGAQMLAGSAFALKGASVKRVSPGSVTVSVLNGAGRDGVAAQAARILTRDGYRIKDVGNANQFVYDRTLVVYKSDRRPADAVARDLGLGKVIASRGMYSFATDILVVVGTDWPQAP